MVKEINSWKDEANILKFFEKTRVGNRAITYDYRPSVNFSTLLQGSASLVSQLVKNPPAMQETLVRFLGQEDLLEKGTATHSSILACRIPWTA